MRLHYYAFPETMTNEECYNALGYGETGRPYYKDMNYRDLAGISITTAKKLLKKYGGLAWTEHCEREGGLIEVSEIKIKGNNSRFKYSHHL